MDPDMAEDEGGGGPAWVWFVGRGTRDEDLEENAGRRC